MPSPRFWEMENGRTEFGHIDANTNDLAKLLFAEFVLLFSNDWCVVPLEIEVGSFARVDGLLVSDVFGEQTWVRAANRGADATWHHWSMYLLTGDDTEGSGLFLAPALTTTAEAPPLEQVQFIRDEMANMVWAIEQRVASRLGEGVSLGSRAPRARSRLVRPRKPATCWARRCRTTGVRSFPSTCPARSEASGCSARACLVHCGSRRRRSCGSQGDYFIEEEEVPRAGRIVQRTFQRARWNDGKTFLWLGRRSQTGRGEGSSGLAFDHVLERGEPDLV